MAQVKLLKIASNGVPQEMNSAADDIELQSFSIPSGPSLSSTGLAMLSQPVSGLIAPVADDEAANKQYVDDQIEAISFAQTRYVSKNGSDVTGSGALSRPYASITAALASITDASPTNRYAIMVEAGNYTESSVALKANVFIIGAGLRAVRITGAVSMAADFTGGSDHRSGFSEVTLLSAVDFNWQTVTSAAGKIYCNRVLFNTTVNLYGHNNAIAQAQFDSCQFFGVMTISGINVGLHANNVHFSNIVMNQHPNGGMATILNAMGGSVGTVTLTASVNNFGRRCSLFAKEFWMDSLTVDGPSAFADLTTGSHPNEDINKINGGNVVYLNTISPGGLRPDSDNNRYIGDFGRQWLFTFSFVHASSGSDLYLLSTGSSFGADSSGKSIFITPDGYGLQANVSGGNVVIETAAVSGTGVRGRVEIDARELSMSSAKIVDLQDPTAPQDAATKAYVDAQAELVVSKTAGEAIAVGDVLVLNSSGEVVKADISTSALSKVIGLATSAAASGASVSVRLGGMMSALSGLTAGSRYFLAAGGTLSTSSPTTSGEYIVQVGYAASATELVVSLQQMGQRS